MAVTRMGVHLKLLLSRRVMGSARHGNLAASLPGLPLACGNTGNRAFTAKDGNDETEALAMEVDCVLLQLEP